MSNRSKKKQPPNLLEWVPSHNKAIAWETDEHGAVTLLVENKGLFNRIAQKLFKKAPVSHVHLDEMGSFVWPLIDGESTVLAVGKTVKAHFGEAAEPLYERLAKFFTILESYGFIQWNPGK